MMSHPSGRDPIGDAAVARVNAIRAARGLLPIVERNPRQVRAGLIADRDAAMIAVAVLHRAGCGAAVPDAIDAVLDGKPTVVALDLPSSVARVILDRVPSRHGRSVFDALDPELARFAARVAAQPNQARELAELCVHGIAVAVWSGIVASIEAAGSGAMLPDFSGPAPEAVDQLAGAAADAATFAVRDVVDRLRAQLLTLAGLP